MTHSLVDIYRLFGGTGCLHFQVRKVQCSLYYYIIATSNLKFSCQRVERDGAQRRTELQSPSSQYRALSSVPTQEYHVKFSVAMVLNLKFLSSGT
jgi:hypothetical protein